MHIRVLLFVIACFIFAGCSNPGKNEQVDLGYDYFPVQTGATWIYSVDSLAYDDNSGQTTVDTFTFKYKEQITGTFTDITGQQAQYVSRFFKYHDTLPWVAVNRYTQMRTSLNAQRVEDNIRLVKLVFPLEKNKRWNANLFNGRDSIAYKVSYVHEPFKQYPLTTKILQQEETNAIEEIIKYEVYARDVGMVYALSDSLNTQFSGTKGYRYRLTLLSFTP